MKNFIAHCAGYAAAALLTLLTPSTRAQTDGLDCTAAHLVGSIELREDIRAMEVLDGLAYAIDVDDRLLVIDVRDPTDPTQLSRVPIEGRVSHLSVGGDLACVAGSRLRTFNISDPENPVPVGDIAVSGAVGIESTGTHAFLITTDELMIFDLSSSDPVLIATFEPGHLRDFQAVVLDENQLYIAAMNGIHLLDVADPAQPIARDWVSTHGPIRTIDVHGRFVYVAGSSLWVFDDSLDRYGYLPVRHDGRDDVYQIVASDQGVFVHVSHGVMWAVDASDPDRPVRRATYSMEGLNEIGVEEGTLVAAGRKSFGIVDPDIRNQDPELGRLIETDFFRAVGVEHPCVIASGRDNGYVIDVSDATNPIVRSEFALPRDSHEVIVRDRIAYLATEGAGVLVMDVSDLDNPSVLAHWTDVRSVNAITLADDYLYAGGLWGGFYVIDVSDPTNPTTIGSMASERIYECVVENSIAALSEDGEGLVLVDISEPAQPVRIAQHTSPSYHEAMAYRDGIAFVASTYSLYTIDMRDPNNPVELDVRGLYGTAHLERNGPYLQIAHGSGIRQYDVSDPFNLRFAGEWSQARDYFDVASEGDLIYAALANNDPLVILRTGPCHTCDADFNQDGAVDSRDFVAFLAAWSDDRDRDCSDGSCSSDLNGDGAADTQDFVLFLQLWSDGC